jgi:hypothetical protein
MRVETADILGHVVTDAAGATVDTTPLLERRQRVVRSYIAGNIPEPEHDAMLAEIDEELGRLDAAARASLTWTLGVDWTLPPRELNGRLRELVTAIRLDSAMRPIGAVWTRRPIITETADGEPVYDPAAEAAPGGWFLPSSGRRAHEDVSPAPRRPRGTVEPHEEEKYA